MKSPKSGTAWNGDEGEMVIMDFQGRVSQQAVITYFRGIIALENIDR